MTRPFACWLSRCWPTAMSSTEDVPGAGKTLLARAFSRALGMDFARVQGTPDLLPVTSSGETLDGSSLRFIAGPIHQRAAGRRINRATPRTQSALLEAMEEGNVSIEGETRAPPIHSRCWRPRTPSSLRARSPCLRPSRPLPGRIRLGYPNRRTRQDRPPLSGSGRSTDRRTDRHAGVDHRDARGGQSSTSSPSRATSSTWSERHATAPMRLGGSPRATVALYRAAQATAYLAGRDFVAPDDVSTVPAVLAYRILLDIDTLRGSTAEEVIEGSSDVAARRSRRRPRKRALTVVPSRVRDLLSHWRRPGGCRRAGPGRCPAGHGRGTTIGVVVRVPSARVRAPLSTSRVPGANAPARPRRPQCQTVAAAGPTTIS